MTMRGTEIRTWLPGFNIFDKFREFISWRSLDGFTVGGDAAYSVTCQDATVLLATGYAAADYDCFLKSASLRHFLVAAGKVITVEFIISWLSHTSFQTIWLRMAQAGEDPPIIDHVFGWKILNADLYAENDDGTTQTITDTGVNITSTTQFTRLKMVFTPGTNIKFYVNDVLKVTHTTNLPTGAHHVFHCHIRTHSTAANATAIRKIELQRALIEKEY